MSLSEGDIERRTAGEERQMVMVLAQQHVPREYRTRVCVHRRELAGAPTRIVFYKIKLQADQWYYLRTLSAARNMHEATRHSRSLHPLLTLSRHLHAHRLRAVGMQAESVGVGVVGDVAGEGLQGHVGETLSLRDGTVLVRDEQCLEVDNFFPQLRHLCRERVVLGAEQFHFGLQVGEPLLLPLTALQCRDAAVG